MCLHPITIVNPNYGAFTDCASPSAVSSSEVSAMVVRGPQYYSRVGYHTASGGSRVACLRNDVSFAPSRITNTSTRYLALKDCTSRYIDVPCGSCSECASTKQNYFAQRCYLQGRESAVFMLTLTASNEFLEDYPLFFRSGSSVADNCHKSYVDNHYQFFTRYVRCNSENLPASSFDCEDDDMPSEFLDESQVRAFAPSPVVDESGSSSTFPFLPYSYVQNFFKRVRKRDIFGAPFKYSLCYEFGGKKRRPHYHILFYIDLPQFSNEKYSDYEMRMRGLAAKWSHLLWREWSVNVGSRKFPVYRNISLYRVNGSYRQPFDFHFVSPYDKNGRYDSSVFYYTSKYMYKFNDWFNRLNLKVKYFGLGDFKEWRRVCCPKVRTSKRLGVTSSSLAYIRDCFQKSLLYVSSGVGGREVNTPLFVCSDGSTAPMSPYLQKLMPWSEYLDFYEYVKKCRGICTDDWPSEYRNYDQVAPLAQRMSRSVRVLSAVRAKDDI